MYTSQSTPDLSHWTGRGGLFEDGHSGRGRIVDAHAEEAVGGVDGGKGEALHSQRRGAHPGRPRHAAADAVLQAYAPHRLLLGLHTNPLGHHLQ